MPVRSLNVSQKLIASHLVSGRLVPGEEAGLRMDQALLQDALGTIVMLALEAMGLDRVKTEIAVQYVDHNLLQTDFKNADDHVFLMSAAQRFGIRYSRPGNGISHPVHMERFGKPGKSLVGSDSHTCAAGSLGMLAIGAGSLDVATVLAGEPLHVRMPEVWGIKLAGRLPEWVSAKDVILELLRRHSVDGGLGRVIEYYGPGVATLSAMDRHVIANMGAELGATTTVFPSDHQTRDFLHREGRGGDWMELAPDPDCSYDHHDEIDLSKLEPLIARPSSPGNVVKVRDVAGQPLCQSYIGSSANPGYRDFAVAALMVRGKQVDPAVSFDINPTSREILENLVREGFLGDLIHAGARIHQTGCNGCNGMGQAPATGRNSLRTTPRNFPGRSGNKEDSVFLCSPETATASALSGKITDPRDLGVPYPRVRLPRNPIVLANSIMPPPPLDEALKVRLVKGPNINSLPTIAPLADLLEVPVLLKLGDDVSTDTISPAGARALPFRSNVQRIADFSFDTADDTYPERAKGTREAGGHAIVAGMNYGQGSSREHATLAPGFLGLRVVLSKSFARIHAQNLPNAGILPLMFVDLSDYDAIRQNDVLIIRDLREAVATGDRLIVELKGKRRIEARHPLTARQVDIMLCGGLINWLRDRERPSVAREQRSS
jgi:aconitate hydratase